MSTGPIEFASAEPRDDKPPTEYGGMAGLIQDHPDVVLSGGDKRGLIVRGRAVVTVDPVTGLVTVDEAATAVDPVTGREVESDDGSVVAPVEPLKTGEPQSGVL